MGVAERETHIALSPYLFRPGLADQLPVYRTETYQAELPVILAAIEAATGTAPERLDFDPKEFRDALAKRAREIKLGFLSGAGAGAPWAIPLAERSAIVIRPEDAPAGDQIRGILPKC